MSAITASPCRRSALACLLAVALAACGTTQTAAPPPGVQPPAAFREAPAGWALVPPAESQPRGAWWQAFGDPVLNGLAERAAAANARIDEAAARLAQTRAAVLGAQAARAPQLNATAGASRQGGPLVNAAGSDGTLLTLAAGVSYDVDLFGRLAAAGDAAAMDAESAAALLQSTRLLVQAELAQAYLALRALDAERGLQREAVAAWRDTLRTTQQRLRLGAVAEVAVARVQAELAASEAELSMLDRRRAELEHAVALLVGEPASSFTLAESAVPVVLPQVPPGVPSSVLARRADVAAAQQHLLATQSRLGAARAAWFPSLTLTASGGQASPELAKLLSGSVRAWGVAALLSLPLLDGGRREAAQRQAQAEVDLALAQHRGQVLGAFREVEDQLAALRLLADQAQAQQRAADAAQRGAELSGSRFRQGLASQLETLDGQRAALLARRQLLQVEAARRQATVALIRALGGGWDSAPQVAAAKSR